MLNTKVLWFTGLSGSGKSTIAAKLQDLFSKEGKTFQVFDGDDVRNRLHKHLGFSREDILENNRLILELCKQAYGTTDFILVPIISPFSESRNNARQAFMNNFIEIYLDCPYADCKRRDVKGHYKKAESGELSNFIGLHIPYELPLSPEITLRTMNETPEQSFHKILAYLKSKQSII